MESDTHFMLGAHAAQIENIEKRVASMDEKLDKLVAVSEQMRGGYKALASAGAVGGAIGAGAVKFIAFLKGG